MYVLYVTTHDFLGRMCGHSSRSSPSLGAQACQKNLNSPSQKSVETIFVQRSPNVASPHLDNSKIGMVWYQVTMGELPPTGNTLTKAKMHTSLPSLAASLRGGGDDTAPTPTTTTTDTTNAGLVSNNSLHTNRRSRPWSSNILIWIPLLATIAWLTTSQIMNQVDINTRDYLFALESSTVATLSSGMPNNPKRALWVSATGANPAPLRQEERPIRVLWSIFTTESPGDKVGARYRQLFRNLFDKTVGQIRACPLSRVTPTCELIYTFVVGGNASAATSIRDLERPAAAFLLSAPSNATLSSSGPYFPDDETHDDITRLDIAENMDEDKSPTWFGHVSKIMDDLEIDYVAKLDTDTLPILDKYFAFVQQELRPAPPLLGERKQKNHRVIVGILADLINFYDHVSKQNLRDRSNYLRPKFGNIPPHYYFRGEFYMLSRQLTKDIYHTFVTNYPQMPNWQRRFEDQIISALAFNSPGPVQSVMLSKTDAFWRHPVKLKNPKACEKAWQSEVDRLLANNNSTLLSLGPLAQA